MPSSHSTHAWEIPWQTGIFLSFPENEAWKAQQVKEWIAYLYTAIEAKGYAFNIKGGFVLDVYLGLMPNDADGVCNCPEKELLEIGKGYLQKTKRQDTYKIGNYIQITYINTSNEKLLPTAISVSHNDLKINGLGINRYFQILDPNGFLKYIRQNQLIMMGNPEETFSNDAVRILRAIRISSKTGKFISSHDALSIKKFAPLLTAPQSGLPFGVYLTQFQALFLRGQACLNFFKLYRLGVLPHLLPSFVPTGSSDLYVPKTIRNFWKKELEKIDECEPTTRRFSYTSYHPMGLLLLLAVFPQGKKWIQPQQSTILKAINEFGEKYPDPTCDIKRLQNSLFSILNTYALQFFDYYTALKKNATKQRLATSPSQKPCTQQYPVLGPPPSNGMQTVYLGYPIPTLRQPSLCADNAILLQEGSASDSVSDTALPARGFYIAYPQHQQNCTASTQNNDTSQKQNSSIKAKKGNEMSSRRNN